MTTFQNNQRIRVIDPDDGHEPLKGKTGTVVRLRMADNCAWIDMDEALPENLQSFPPLTFTNPQKPEPRHKHIMLWPDECEAV